MVPCAAGCGHSAPPSPLGPPCARSRIVPHTSTRAGGMQPAASPSSEIDEKLDRAAEAREEGNALFKAGEHSQAMFKWHEVLNYVRGLDRSRSYNSAVNGKAGGISMEGKSSLTDEQNARMLDLLVAAHGNLAAGLLKARRAGVRHCQRRVTVPPSLGARARCRRLADARSAAPPGLQKGKWERVVENCNAVLDLDSSHVKCLARRAKAYVSLNDADAAEADLRRVFALEPGNTDALRTQQEVVRLREVQHRTEASLYAKMFSKATLS